MTREEARLLEPLGPAIWMNSAWVLIAGTSAGLYLAYLVDTSKPNYKDWFTCSSKKTEEDMNIPKWKQDRLIRKLKDKGIISTKYNGVKKVRMIRINIQRINELTSKAVKKWRSKNGQ